MHKFIRSSLIILAIVIITIFLLALKPSSYQMTSAQSAYPAPDSPTLKITSQVDSPVFAYPPPSTPKVTITPTPIPAVNQDDSSFVKDAKSYASIMGVNFEEAKRRLLLQSEISELNLQLAEKEPYTYGGLWIQHKPDFRVIVLFTHDGETIIRQYIQNGPLTDLVYVITGQSTLIDLENTRKQASEITRKSGISFSSAINIPNNQAEIYVQDPDLLTKSLLISNAKLPDNLAVIKFKELSRPVTEIWGGEELTTCTSGFAVMGPGGIKGVTTAGHCQDTQAFNGVNLPFMSGTVGGLFDIQWHRADQDFTVRNLIWDGTYARFIFDVKFRASQSVGEFVCKFGKTSGYACGTIATTSQDGVNVRVDQIVVQGGDSGGPWFWNNTAYGTTISACLLNDNTPCAIYGPVDQIYNILGLVVLPAKYYLPIIQN